MAEDQVASSSTNLDIDFSGLEKCGRVYLGGQNHQSI